MAVDDVCPTIAAVGDAGRIVTAGLAALVLALGPGCSGGDDDTRTGTSGDGAGGRSAEASPFTVDAVPPGFSLEIAGRGTATQNWGDDSTGTDVPYTVLAPPGDGADSDRAVIVAVTGYEGYQGGLAQATSGYLDGDSERFEVDGRPAIYSPGGTDADGEPQASDLVVVRGDDLAVRVAAHGADRDRLVDIAERVEPDDDRSRAPRVIDPPDDLEVVGSVDAGVAIGLWASVRPDSDAVPGLPSAYAAGWLSGRAPAPETGPGPAVTSIGPGSAGAPSASPSDESPSPTSLALVAYPGEAADLAALAAIDRVTALDRTVTPTVVDGRPGMVVEYVVPGDGYAAALTSRTVLTHAPWGDLLMVTGEGRPELVPSTDQLAGMLASVRQASPAEWEAFEVEAAGGPGLFPDDGAVELDRGTVPGADGDVEWLLQARPGALDSCLKLSTRERACSVGGSSSDGNSYGTGGGVADRDGGIPEFLVVTIPSPGASLRVTTPEGAAEGALHQIPDSELWGGVVFAPGMGTAALMCPDTAEPPEHMTPVTVEVLDEVGEVIGCVDLGGFRPA